MKTDLIVDLVMAAVGIGFLVVYKPAREVFFGLFREDPAFKTPEPSFTFRGTVLRWADIERVLTEAGRGITIGVLAAELLMPPDEVYRSVLLLVQEGFLHATEIEGDVLISLG